LSVTVDFNKGAVKKKIDDRMKRVQLVLDSQIMKDSNYYIPKQEGFLARSVFSSLAGNGVLVWTMEYARKMYHFEGRLSKEVNPNASTKWFERAKATKLKEWEALVNREYSK